MNWYALHVRSQSEHVVAAKLDGCGIEAFYPFKPAKSRDGRRDIEKKFMPGYVFSRFDLAQKTPVIAIEQVVAILGWGHHAVAIPDSEIEAVQRIVRFPSLATPCDYLAEGDHVRVNRGPLTGLEGFVMYKKNSVYVVVSVTMLARSISAEIDAGDLEILPLTVAA